jgi:hypothetical protein
MVAVLRNTERCEMPRFRKHLDDVRALKQEMAQAGRQGSDAFSSAVAIEAEIEQDAPAGCRDWLSRRRLDILSLHSARLGVAAVVSCLGRQHCRGPRGGAYTPGASGHPLQGELSI